MALQAVSGLFGGIGLVADPSGDLIRMPLSNLDKSPFTTFLIPGLILLIFLGIVPALLVYSLFAKPVWKWAECLNIFHDTFWGWTYSLYTGLILIIWIDIEHIMIQSYTFLQPLFSLVGVLIVICCLVPSVKNFYKKDININGGEY